MHKFRHWLDRLPLNDPLERRQARVFQSVLLGWIALASIGIPALMTLSSSQNNGATAAPVSPIFGVVGMVLSAASSLLWISPVAAFVVLRRGRFKLSVTVAAFGLLLSHTVATIIMGVNQTSIGMVFQIPIALAGLLAGRKLLIAVTVFSYTLVATVGILQMRGVPLVGIMDTATAAGGSAASQSILISVFFFIAVTMIVATLLDRFGGALREALSSSQFREAELQDMRAMLETTVKQRTAALQTALNDVQTRAQEQDQLLAELNQQREMIKDLSVPVIPINGQTLIMPLVGALDTLRLEQLQTQSLKALEHSSARTLLLDITGVPVVDTQVAQGLLMTVRAARLLGTDVALVGIRPEVAQTIVGLGINLQDVRTFSSLETALARVLAA